MALLLGCIADDLTGATDLASTLVRQGMRTVQLVGVPAAGQSMPDADAVVIALKSRTVPAPDAVAQSLAALGRLRAGGARQFFFKYCSTFDSTDQGNIGPVIDALLAELGETFTIACPAYPENGRTVYLGHLFVAGALLSESSMRDHPLTPMTDANLVRVLGRQTQARVDLVPYSVVRQGPDAIAAAFVRLRITNVTHAIVDAVEDRHLLDIGTGCADMALVTGGSGVALGLPENFRRLGLLAADIRADVLPSVGGQEAVIAGSCSAATLTQIGHLKRSRPALAIDPKALALGEPEVERAVSWARERLQGGPVLIYASAPPEIVAQVQTQLGRERAGAMIEQALAEIAAGLVEAGVRRLIVAGGETSGAVMQRLGVKALRIGPQIDPGVPWTVTIGEPRLALALKSGNFGKPDFFIRAFGLLS